MTDQPHSPGGPGNAPGNSGAWQPVPDGGDYDPDQTMHVSFAAQLPPEPRPGEDPLSAHGPVGPMGEHSGPGYDSGYGPAEHGGSGQGQVRGQGQGPGSAGGTGRPGSAGAPGAAGNPGEDRDPATQWSIPVIREDAESDSGEYPVGGYLSPWDQAPSPAAPTSTFPAGMFGQGAAAAQAAQSDAAAQARAGGTTSGLSPADLTGEWQMPFTGPEGGDAVPWLPAHAPAADAAWSSVVDDPEGPADARSYGHPGEDTEDGPDTGTPAQSTQEGAAPDAAEAASEALRRAADHDGPPAPDLDAEGPDAAGSGDAVDGAAVLEGLDGLGGLDADGEPEAPEPVLVEETRSEHPLASYMLRVNGSDRPVTDAWLGESLLYVLRERLGLAGAKDGCEQGECGACSVQVDGRLVASCLVPAATAAGSEVRTVEGLTVEGRPSKVQRALAESGAVQCGFCIPGMAMTVHNLLEGNHKPTDLDIRQALSGNLCRCSGYRGVIDAVRRVVADREADDEATADEVRVPHQGGPAGSLGGQGGPAGGHSGLGGQGTPGGAG